MKKKDYRGASLTNQTAGTGNGYFIDEPELLRRVPICRRTLWDWRASGKIPFVKAGARRVLFHWPSVEAALLRHQRNSPGVGH